MCKIQMIRRFRHKNRNARKSQAIRPLMSIGSGNVKKSSNGFVRIIIDVNATFLYLVVGRRRYKWHLFSDKNRFDSHLLPTLKMSLKGLHQAEHFIGVVTVL